VAEVIEPVQDEEGVLRADVTAIVTAIKRLGVENVLCVLSTTSCFAPRVPD
jgi:O-phospho-L-seryl-tRNASec:L-selenocysteinyl-tRNA synthase